MSAHTLRENARLRIDAAIEREKDLLAGRVTDEFPELRLRQGVVKGLREAVEIINETYKDMQGL